VTTTLDRGTAESILAWLARAEREAPSCALAWLKGYATAVTSAPLGTVRTADASELAAVVGRVVGRVVLGDGPPPPSTRDRRREPV
jgi:hypothetical protein